MPTHLGMHLMLHKCFDLCCQGCEWRKRDEEVDIVGNSHRKIPCSLDFRSQRILPLLVRLPLKETVLKVHRALKNAFDWRHVRGALFHCRRQILLVSNVAGIYACFDVTLLKSLKHRRLCRLRIHTWPREETKMSCPWFGEEMCQAPAEAT